MIIALNILFAGKEEHDKLYSLVRGTVDFRKQIVLSNKLYNYFYRLLKR